jgi:hypothetical protein
MMKSSCRGHARTILAVAAMVVLAPTVSTVAEISKQERTQLVSLLTSSRDEVLAEAAKLSDAQWSFKSGPDRWSVGEVVEHLALAEPFLFDSQQKMMTGTAATPEQLKTAQSRDELILKVIPDRTKKVAAPEPLQPTKKIGTRADVLAAFRDRRAKTLEYASKTTDDLRGRVSDSPLGPLDGYQWLLFIGAHTQRHLAQIREVKADAQFPKAAAP